jgi:hypothetical protein
MQLSSQLSNDQLIAICEIANVISCNCPSRLVQLLQQVKEFSQYTEECVTQFPEDVETHRWLQENITDVENQLMTIMIEFLRRENLLNEKNELCFNQLEARAKDSIHFAI